MRRGFCKVWMSAISIAVVMGGAGCGGDSASTPEATSPAVDPDVAFEKYEKVARPFECSKAYSAMGDAAYNKEFDAMKTNAREHRGVVARWDAELGKIAFPAAAQPIVDRMRELTASELTGLDDLIEVDVQDAERRVSIRSQVEVDDAAVTVEGDHLRAALDHPTNVFTYAADQLELADATFFRDLVPPSAKFKAAIAANDLDGAKAANAMEIDTLQRYIDTLDTIDWPSGSFGGQANRLRGHLRGQIEFDRRQTDVATAAQIVRAPEGGTPEMNGFRMEFDALWTALARTGQATNPELKC